MLVVETAAATTRSLLLLLLLLLLLQQEQFIESMHNNLTVCVAIQQEISRLFPHPFHRQVAHQPQQH